MGVLRDLVPVLGKPSCDPIRVRFGGLQFCKTDRAGEQTGYWSDFFKVVRVQADLIKPAALAGQGFGVGVGVDSEVIENLGLKDLAFRLTGINWEQETEDGDQCVE